MKRVASAITLRPLTAGDLKAVNDLCKNVYNGVDFLPGRIAGWFNNEDVHTIGFETDGRLVAMHTAHVIDHETVLLKGLRVHPEHRRRGIGSLLGDAIIETVRCRVPEVKRFLTAIESHNKSQCKMRANWTEIHRVAYMCAEFSKDVLRFPKVASILASGTKQTSWSSDKLCSVLLTKPEVFPRLLIRESQPFSLTKIGIERSEKQGDVWFVKGDSVSSGSYLCIPGGTNQMWSADVYGKSQEEVYFHVIEQLKYGYRHVGNQPLF
eukprot:m.31781 g.31781  ORF g.31781 m.31781 type:complete len:266 (+) comp31544_c0_seq1:41-838(+)